MMEMFSSIRKYSNETKFFIVFINILCFSDHLAIRANRARQILFVYLTTVIANFLIIMKFLCIASILWISIVFVWKVFNKPPLFRVIMTNRIQFSRLLARRHFTPSAFSSNTTPNYVLRNYLVKGWQITFVA